MKLDGTELAGFIKARHADAVRGLPVVPSLTILMHPDAGLATRLYVEKSKQGYGEDIGAQVVIREVAGSTAELTAVIEELNADSQVHGILIQLPYPGVDEEQLLASVAPHKDIDGLGPNTMFDMPTPKAILWLLAAYNIDYKGKAVAVIGQGRLVGAPLSDILENSGAHVTRCDDTTPDLAKVTLASDIIISATGHPKLITPAMVRPDTVLVGAGTSDVGGQLGGDLDPALYADESLRIARNTGGVGPVTVAALFDNLLQAVAASNR